MRCQTRRWHYYLFILTFSTCIFLQLHASILHSDCDLDDLPQNCQMYICQMYLTGLLQPHRKKGRNPVDKNKMVAGPSPKKARSKPKKRPSTTKPTYPKLLTTKVSKPAVVTPPSKTVQIESDQTTPTQLLFELD